MCPGADVWFLAAMDLVSSSLTFFGPIAIIKTSWLINSLPPGVTDQLSGKGARLLEV